MSKGKKTGGRTKGTANKDKQQLIDMIQEEYPDYHPLLALAKIANEDIERCIGFSDGEPVMVTDHNLKLQASKEVCKYIVPQLKAIEHTGKDGKDLIPSLSDEEITKRINRILNPEG